MKFKIDENLPVEVAAILNNAGHDAHTVADERIKGVNDDRFYSICIDETRILLTLDLDFADIRKYQPGHSPGIIVLRLFKQNKNSVIETIKKILPKLKKEKPIKRLWIVEENRIRVRE